MAALHMVDIGESRLLVGEFELVPHGVSAGELNFELLRWALPGGRICTTDELRVWAQETGRTFQRMDIRRK